jgi:hypothetical protein
MEKASEAKGTKMDLITYEGKPTSIATGILDNIPAKRYLALIIGERDGFLRIEHADGARVHIPANERTITRLGPAFAGWAKADADELLMHSIEVDADRAQSAREASI